MSLPSYVVQDTTIAASSSVLWGNSVEFQHWFVAPNLTTLVNLLLYLSSGIQFSLLSTKADLV